MPKATPNGPMLGTRISVQEYAAAFAEPTVKMIVIALTTVTRWMNEAFMAPPLVVSLERDTFRIAELLRGDAFVRPL
jgi:hypothetical protein